MFLLTIFNLFLQTFQILKFSFQNFLINFLNKIIIIFLTILLSLSLIHPDFHSKNFPFTVFIIKINNRLTKAIFHTKINLTFSNTFIKFQAQLRSIRSQQKMKTSILICSQCMSYNVVLAILK